MPESCKPQPHKMIQSTQTIRRLLPTNWLSLFDHFVELALQGLNLTTDLLQLALEITFSVIPGLILCWDHQKYCENIMKTLVTHTRLFLLGKYFFCKGWSQLKPVTSLHFPLFRIKLVLKVIYFLSPVEIRWKQQKNATCWTKL